MQQIRRQIKVMSGTRDAEVWMALTCVCSCCRSCCAMRLRQQAEVWRDWPRVAHTGHIPEDWPEMLCSQLTAGFSLLRLLLPSLRDKQQLCFCCPLSPPFTRTVAAATEGRLGAADCDQQSLSLSLSLLLSLCASPPSLAPSNHGSGKKWQQSHFKTSCLVFLLIYGKWCVTKILHSDTIQALEAVGDSFTNTSPFSPPLPLIYPYTHPATHPPFTSATPACWNESPSISQSYLWLELQY